MRKLSILTSLAAFAAAIPCQAHLVADLVPGTSSSVINNSIVAFGEDTVFSALEGGELGLYLSNGTAVGTTRIMMLDDTAPYSYPTGLCTVGGVVFFSFGDSTTGAELWKTDGSAAGTGLVKDIRPGPLGSAPGNMIDVNGTVYFSAAATSGNYELYKSDGTAGGTVLVKDIHPTAGSTPRDLCQLGTTSTLLFVANDGVTNGWELWKSDGTATGTVLVKDIKPGGGAASSSHPRYLAQFGDRVAFAATASGNDYELWLSDGTEAGTEQVTIGRFGNTSTAGPRHIAAQGDALYFQAMSSTSGGNELFVSDGTDAGTISIDIYAGAYGSFPFMMTPIGSRFVFFQAYTFSYGTELYLTDGTPTGTALYQDIWSGSGSGNPNANGFSGTHLKNSRYAVTAGGKMFFYASDPTHGYELWVFDSGTNAAATSHGSSCSGLSLAATPPYLGETCTLTTSGIPAAAVLSALALSFTRHSPPIDLTGFGMPGCYQHTGLDSVHFLFGSPTATFSLAIPAVTSWLGAKIQGQSFSLIPGINPGGAISSNGVTLTIGDQ